MIELHFIDVFIYLSVSLQGQERKEKVSKYKFCAVTKRVSFQILSVFPSGEINPREMNVINFRQFVWNMQILDVKRLCGKHNEYFNL